MQYLGMYKGYHQQLWFLQAEVHENLAKVTCLVGGGSFPCHHLLWLRYQLVLTQIDTWYPSWPSSVVSICFTVHIPPLRGTWWTKKCLTSTKVHPGKADPAPPCHKSRISTAHRFAPSHTKPGSHADWSSQLCGKRQWPWLVATPITSIVQTGSRNRHPFFVMIHDFAHYLIWFSYVCLSICLSILLSLSLALSQEHSRKQRKLVLPDWPEEPSNDVTSSCRGVLHLHELMTHQNPCLRHKLPRMGLSPH